MLIPITALLATAAGFIPAAEVHWGGPPPCGTPTVTVEVIPDHGGLAYLSECRIAINAQPWQRRNLCILMVHEMGHLHGHNHEPGTVMDADAPWFYPPLECPPETHRRKFSWRHRVRKQMNRQRMHTRKDTP